MEVNHSFLLYVYLKRYYIYAPASPLSAPFLIHEYEVHNLYWQQNGKMTGPSSIYLFDRCCLKPVGVF